MAPTSSLVSKIKVQLKLAISRLRMVQQKDTAIAKQQRRAMAVLLEQNKIESARIRVENIIRSDLTTELHEILELYCELLLARAGLLDSKDGGGGGGCDPGLEEAVKSLIYAAPRTEIKELHQARQLLVEKFGKEFALDAAENRDGKVAPRVLRKLRVEPPEEQLVLGYLGEIARTYGVEWPKGNGGGEGAEQEGKDAGTGDGRDDEDDDQPGSGGQAVRNLEAPLTTDDELSRATPPRDWGPKSPVRVAPPSPSTDNWSPRVKLPGPPDAKPGAQVGGGMKKQTVGTAATAATAATPGQSEAKGEEAGGAKAKAKGGTVGGKIPDVDDLQKRFAELKRRG